MSGFNSNNRVFRGNSRSSNWRSNPQAGGMQQQYMQPQMPMQNSGFPSGQYYQQQEYQQQPSPSRGRPRRGGISARLKDNIRQPLSTVESLPSGQHLSKTTSELKNDPLYLEAFFPSPSEELRPISEDVNHYVGFEGLTTLIEESFENLSAHNFNFKRSLSLSAYTYYITVLAWARVLYLKRLNHYHLSLNEEKFVNLIYDGGNFTVPKSIGIYFSGFGNFNIPSGPESKFDLKPYSYDLEGYFENFATQFYLCTSYPNISIAAERVMRDVLITNNNNVAPAWNPNEQNFEWNNRCIGYAPAVRLTDVQYDVIQRAQVREDHFPSDTPGFLLNIRLMNSVQKYLLEVPSLESSVLPTNLTGSQGQFVIEHVDETSRSLATRSCIGSASFTAKSPLSCPGSMAYLGSSFLYRINKRITASRAKFFFPYNLEPTAAETLILNTLNTGWSPIFENIYHYADVSFKPSLRIKKFCSIDIKLAST